MVREGSDGGESLGALVARTEGVQPGRRLFHAVSGTGIALILLLADPSRAVAIGALGAALALAAALDLLRLSRPALNRSFFRLLRPLASPREAAGIASSTWYLVGVLLAVALFPRSVAVLAILVLALADSAASYVGRRWGRSRFGTGTVEGSLTFALVASCVLVPVAGPVAGGLTAVLVTLAEPLSGPADDNLVVPLLTGAFLWSLMPWWA